MSVRGLDAMLLLLVAAFAAVATGQNVSGTVPPVYNTTRTASGATSFNTFSSISEPSTVFKAVTELATEPTEGVLPASTVTVPTVQHITATQPEMTRQPQVPVSAGTFVLPEVDGLVGGDLRSSIDSATTPSEYRAVQPTAPFSKSEVTADTTVDSSTLALYASDTPTSLVQPGSTADMASTVAVTSNPGSEKDDLSFVSSISPEIDLFDGATTTEGVALPASTFGVDASTTHPPTVYNMSRERYCIAARFCYKELNERCVMRHMKSVCGCGRAFFRNPETLVCERKLPLLVSLELPEHSYVQEVADKKSLEFKAYESAAHHLVREEAEPLAFPPLASYEPEDQAFLKFYGTESSASYQPEPTTTVAV